MSGGWRVCKSENHSGQILLAAPTCMCTCVTLCTCAHSSERKGACARCVVTLLGPPCAPRSKCPETGGCARAKGHSGHVRKLTAAQEPATTTAKSGGPLQLARVHILHLCMCAHSSGHKGTHPRSAMRYIKRRMSVFMRLRRRAAVQE